jgi:hypothetical protein
MTRTSSSSRHPFLSVTVASASLCAAFALFPTEAHAGNPGRFDLGLDGDATALMAPSPARNNLSTLGSGFKLRFGDHFRLRNGVNLTPEVGYAFDHIFAADSGNHPENMNRIFAGLRLGFGNRVVPTVYAHVGYGFRSVEDNQGNSGIAGDNGLTLDTGVAVEFHLARHLSIGPHAEFVYVDVPNSPQWLAFGGHLDILF